MSEVTLVDLGPLEALATVIDNLGERDFRMASIGVADAPAGTLEGGDLIRAAVAELQRYRAQREETGS